jgi:hypothetical protein
VILFIAVAAYLRTRFSNSGRPVHWPHAIGLIRLNNRTIQYNTIGFWIAGQARTGQPYNKFYNPIGDILYQRPDNSVVELTIFAVGFCQFNDNGVVRLFGLEFARVRSTATGY